MALMAIALPILPGKTPQWRKFIEELNGPRHQEFADSRRQAGVHERTFLQQTPMGDLVIVTLEGDDPGRSFGQLMTGTDAFSQVVRRASHGGARRPADADDRIAVRTRRGLRPGLTSPFRRTASRFAGRIDGSSCQTDRRIERNTMARKKDKKAQKAKKAQAAAHAAAAPTAGRPSKESS